MRRPAWFVLAGLAVLAVARLAVLSPSEPAPVGRDISDTCGTGGDAGFEDVAPSNPHGASIDCIAAYGITSGTSETTYDPDGTLRRDQLATFLAATIEASGKELPRPSGDHWRDTDESAHERAINALTTAAIFSGSSIMLDAPSTDFDVDGVVTRGEMAQHAAAALSYAGVLPRGSVPDYFTDDAGMPAEEAINRLAHVGVVTGQTETTFAPRETLRRDQMATFLARIIDLIEDDGALPEAAEGS